MSSIVIIHFSPLEGYPPVQNLINVLALTPEIKRIFVLSTKGSTFSNRFSHYSPKVNIIRRGKVEANASQLRRLLNYFYFYFFAFKFLLNKRPSTVLYYDTISSLPGVIYKMIFGASKLFIHYHEYVSLKEYREGMTLVKSFHLLEKKIYPQADWLSQTNEARLEKFKADNFPVIITNAATLANYPPRTWYDGKKKKQLGPILKIVYVGAFSIETMFVREFSDWVLKQGGAVEWDIFTGTSSLKAQSYIQSLNTSLIKCKGHVVYEDLPLVLKSYDVGVILYKGHIPNYVYNAPNKLFEYLACGLDVWFPSVMKGSIPFITNTTFPKVISLDFTNLGSFDYKKALSREGLSYSPSNYFCEEELKPLVKKMAD